MFAVFVTALLCLVSLSHSDLSCNNLVQPLDRVDRHSLEGRWALVAGSLTHPEAAASLKARDSVAVDFNNSAYIQANRDQGMCKYIPHNVTLEDQVIRIQVGSLNFTGNFRHTSCADCVVLTLDIESPAFNTTNLYLLSRRRALEDTELEEFKAQVECLKMPEPVMMKAYQDLCPEQAANAAQEGAEA